MSKRLLEKDDSVVAKRPRLLPGHDSESLPNISTVGPHRPEPTSSDEPHGPLITYLIKQADAGWPYFQTIKSKGKDWPGNTEDGLTSKCLFPGDDNENKAGGESAPGFNIYVSENIGRDVPGGDSDLGVSCATTHTSISDISLPQSPDSEHEAKHLWAQEVDCAVWVAEFLSHPNPKRKGIQHPSLLRAKWLLLNSSVPEVNLLAGSLTATQCFPEFLCQAKRFITTVTQGAVGQMLQVDLGLSGFQELIRVTMELTDRIRSLDLLIKKDQSMDLDSD